MRRTLAVVAAFVALLLVTGGVAVGGAVALGLLPLGSTGPAAPEPLRYVVARGDTLGKIAKAHGVTVDQLRAWNQLTGDTIEVGQVLRIEVGAAPVATTPKKKRAKGDVAPGGTAERPDLVMPPERACLSGPSGDGLADEGIVGSSGLPAEAIRSSMSGFVHHTLTCLSGADAPPTTPLDLEITVACTGRVARVEVVGQGDWSDDVAACVADVLRYAPFPAHDLPDGETFRYPLVFSPG